MFKEAWRLVSGKRYRTLSIGYLLVLTDLQHHFSSSEDTSTMPFGNNAQEKFIIYNASCYHSEDKITLTEKCAMLVSILPKCKLF